MAEPQRQTSDVIETAQSSVVLDPRALQANERTLLAWIRTAIALMAFGFVVARLGLWLRASAGIDDRPAFRLSIWIGAALVALGTVANAFAAGRYLAVKRALMERRPVPVDSYGELTLATSLVLVGGILTAYLILR